MDWFDKLFGQKLTLKVHHAEGHVVERQATEREVLRAVDKGWVSPEMVQVRIFHADGSCSVWFHHRDSLQGPPGLTRVTRPARARGAIIETDLHY